MNEMKRVHKVFCVWQEQKEERWLTAMAAQGWHLRKVAFCTYRFVKGQPQDIVYRLYSHPKGEADLKACVQLFEDAGWEWVDRILTWQYFRKPHEEGKLDEILTDSQSKIDALKRWRRFTVIVGALNLYNFFNITFWSAGLAQWHAWPMDFLRLLILALAALLGWGAYEIQKRINQLEDSLL